MSRVCYEIIFKVLCYVAVRFVPLSHTTLLLIAGFLSLFFWSVMLKNSRSQWPRGLRRKSMAARLLRLWVRIPPGHGCLSVVGVVCCQVEVSVTS